MVPRQWQSGGCQKRARGQEKSEGARITREKTRRTGNDALVVKRHVFLIDDQATDTLLTVPRRELITDDGRAGDAQRDVDLLQLLITSVAPFVERQSGKLKYRHEGDRMRTE